jgi:hypothetical protein
MSEPRPLGVLERAVMDQLWSVSESQSVRQVHAALTVQRPLAYVTVMTVLQRLVRKGLVVPNLPFTRDPPPSSRRSDVRPHHRCAAVSCGLDRQLSG